jgi:chromosome segregation ATPase
MQELTLSENLTQIELEINHHKQIAGQSIWEIGRRLNHVKEHDLVHGEFIEWLEKIGIERTEAHRMMKVAKELPNVATLQHLGTTALHLIATLPEAERAQQLERIEQGDNPTVRELQEVKRQLNLAKSENEDLREKNEQLAEQALKGMETKTIEKEVVKEVEVTPADYDSTKSLNQTLMAKNQELSKENQALEEELEELKAKGKISQEMEDLIRQRQGKIQGLEKQISDYKDVLNLIRAGDEFLNKMASLIYTDDKKFRNADEVIGLEIDSMVNRLLTFVNDLQKLRGRNQDIIEGEIV